MKLFALHESEMNKYDANNMRYHGLWVPKEGLVNAIELKELSHNERIAGWWAGRVALGRMTHIVPATEPEVRTSNEATVVLEPLFTELAAITDQRSIGLIRPHLRQEFRAPSRQPSAIEEQVAAALGIEDAATIYGPEGQNFGPVITEISEEFGISVDPNYTSSYATTLGERQNLGL